VPSAITKERLRSTLTHREHGLGAAIFSLLPPRIGRAGFEPATQARPDIWGREELDIIEPVIRELQDEGLNLQGPIPADTAFTKGFLKTIDVIVAMYHDQGLPVDQNMSGFGNAVNMTLGPADFAHQCRSRHRLESCALREGRHRQLERRFWALCHRTGKCAQRSCRFRKRFGQHFLHDPGVIRRIIDRVSPAVGDRIVEIGPGRGALTWDLFAPRAGTGCHRDRSRTWAQSLKEDPRAGNTLHVHV